MMYVPGHGGKHRVGDANLTSRIETLRSWRAAGSHVSTEQDKQHLSVSDAASCGSPEQEETLGLK
jgi:hypothetical protein